MKENGCWPAAGWRQVVVHDAAVESSVAGRLLGLLDCNFAGDVDARLALFERGVSRYGADLVEALSAT